MLCANCTKLNYLHTKKFCIRCHGDVLTNISVLCEFCSSTEKLCAVCLKKVISPAQRINRNCNCGGK